MMLTVCISMLVFLVCVDMGIKQYIEDTLEENEEKETLVRGLVFRKVYNKGFALNILDCCPEIIRKVSLCAGISVILYDVFVFMKKRGKLCKAGMVLVTAGMVSNLYDRMIRGKVIDYIGVRCGHRYLQRLTANLADFYILVGMVFVTVSRMIHRK